MVKASDIIARIDSMDQLISVLEIFCDSDSSLHSISDVMKMKNEDLVEIAGLFNDILKKHA